MRRIKYLISIILLIMLPLSGVWSRSRGFLPSAVNVDASATATNGVEFTSRELNVKNAQIVAFTVNFTRAAGSSSTVDFAFEASFDNGTTWATFEGVTISIQTDHSVVSGTTVRVLKLVNIPGVSHIRAKSITNNDSGNNLTACNVTLSI